MVGKISINRQYSNVRDVQICIAVVDELSRTEFLKIYIEPKDFGLLVCGESRKNCEFELNVKNVGKKPEIKYIDIPLPNEYWKMKIDKELIKSILSEYEGDGWVGSVYDFQNSKNVNGHTDTIRVSFERYVDAESYSEQE